MNLLKLVIDFVGVVFEIIIMQQMFLYLLQGRRVSKRVNALLCLGIAVIMTGATLFDKNLYLMPFVNFLSIFVFSITFRGKWGIRSFLSILLFLLILSSELIAGALLMSFTKVEMVDVQENMSLYLVGVLASKLLVFLLVKVIGYKRLDIYRHMRMRVFMGLLLTPVSSAIAMYVMGMHIQNYRSAGPMVLLLCASALMIIANIFAFHLYEKQLENEYADMRLSFAEKQIKLQMEHYSELSEQQLAIRKLSHDMRNSLAGILGMLEHGNYDAAADRLKKLSGAAEQNTRLFDTGYPAIDALLASKLQATQEKHIPMETYIALPPQMQIDALDLCILLGNALDNAIEASEKIAEEAKRGIRLHISSSDKYLSIRLENGTAEAASDGNSITSKADLHTHGFGLESIRTIAARYDGSVKVAHADSVFCLTVLAKCG